MELWWWRNKRRGKRIIISRIYWYGYCFATGKRLKNSNDIKWNSRDSSRRMWS